MTTVKKNQSISIAILAILTAAALFFATWVSAFGVPSAGAASKGTTACFNTAKGSVFLRTVCKPGERRVVLGLPGATGSVGPSAFDLAKVGGFSGTVAEWLVSLVGISGLSGSAGNNGFAGTTGVAGPTGLTGEDGAAGAEGDAGTVGVAGATGQKGDTGLQGEAGFIPAYGSFYDTTTQKNTYYNDMYDPYRPRGVNAVTFNAASINEFGVSVEGSKIMFANAGNYHFQFAAQLFTGNKEPNLTNQIDIWLKKNATKVPFSNTQVLVQSLPESTGKGVAVWNFVVSVGKGDICEIQWVSQAESMALEAKSKDSTPSLVGVPSVVLTVTQVG